MIVPYSYRGYTVEGFYDEPQPEKNCTFSIYIEAHNSERCQQVASGVASWTEAKAQAKQAIDNLIDSGS